MGIKKPVLSMPAWTVVVFIAIYLVNYFFVSDWLMLLVDEGTLQGIAQSESVSGNTYAGLGVIAVPAAIITGLLANGFCEELLFRGFILKRFLPRTGTWGAIFITAVLFGLMHNALYLIAGIPASFAYHVVVFAIPFIGAVFCGFANEKMFKGSIWPSILIHGIGNAITNIIAAFSN